MELLHTETLGALEAVSLPKNFWGLGQLRHHHRRRPRHNRLSARGTQLSNGMEVQFSGIRCAMPALTQKALHISAENSATFC